MGILDWFQNRPNLFGAGQDADETVSWAVDKAIALTNPQLGLLPDCRKRLAPAVATTVGYLRAQVSALPAVHDMSGKHWSTDQTLRAFFVAPEEIATLLGGSERLHALFGEVPELDVACVALGMTLKELRGFGMALHGDTVQRDVAQTSVSFSDHKLRLAGRDEPALRRAIGIAIFEYLMAQAMVAIGAERDERQELQRDRSLMRARLKLLQQHGPGLASMLGDDPAGPAEQARLEAELLENERQLQAIGECHEALQGELDCLIDVLDHPQRHVQITRQCMRLDKMNVMVEGEGGGGDSATDVEFALVEAKGTPALRRAFVLARVARSDLPPPPKLNLAAAARYL